MALFASPTLASSPASLGEALGAYGVEVPKALFALPITRNKSREGQVMRFSEWIAADSDWRVEVEIDGPYAEGAAEARISGRMRSIDRLYLNQITPYPGEITRLQKCPGELRPKHKQANVLGTSTQVLLVQASQRFTLGVCDPNEASVSGVLGWAYRKKRTELVEIKIFRTKKGGSSAALLSLLSEFKERN